MRLKSWKPFRPLIVAPGLRRTRVPAVKRLRDADADRCLPRPRGRRVAERYSRDSSTPFVPSGVLPTPSEVRHLPTDSHPLERLGAEETPRARPRELTALGRNQP